MSAQDTLVALTDRRWYDFLSSRSVAGRIDEVNFWRPLAQTEFRSLAVGEPFFFRLKRPISAIAGYGFFAHATRLPISLAWEAFGQANGDPTREGFLNRIAEYRRETPAETVLGSRDLTCLILREVHFLPKRSLPVLDAAHIQPYLGPASNHIQNGISLRADIHRLYDTGYVTVTPGYRFEVSRRLRNEYENGRAYYELDGRKLLVVPREGALRPSQKALEWHATTVFQ